MGTSTPAYVDVEPITKGIRNEKKKDTKKQFPSFLGGILHSRIVALKNFSYLRHGQKRINDIFPGPFFVKQPDWSVFIKP